MERKAALVWGKSNGERVCSFVLMKGWLFRHLVLTGSFFYLQYA